MSVSVCPCRAIKPVSVCRQSLRQVRFSPRHKNTCFGSMSAWPQLGRAAFPGHGVMPELHNLSRRGFLLILTYCLQTPNICRTLTTINPQIVTFRNLRFVNSITLEIIEPWLLEMSCYLWFEPKFKQWTAGSYFIEPRNDWKEKNFCLLSTLTKLSTFSRLHPGLLFLCMECVVFFFPSFFVLSVRGRRRMKSCVSLLSSLCFTFQSLLLDLCLL